MTHCNLLPHISQCMSPELWFAKRVIRFINEATTSKNNTVFHISNIGMLELHSVMGSNSCFLNELYDMQAKNVFKYWDEHCKTNSELIRMAAQICEVCSMRDQYECTFLSFSECQDN